MSPNDRAPFTTLMTMLAEVYPASKLNLEIILECYFNDLRHLRLEDVQTIFVIARRRGAFFPTIAELLDIARSQGFPEAPLPPTDYDRYINAEGFWEHPEHLYSRGHYYGHHSETREMFCIPCKQDLGIYAPPSRKVMV